jgi:Xaa-Pro aminopeptidase
MRPCAAHPISRCSGSSPGTPRGWKRIERGDLVHWTLPLSNEGYAIDTSRTKTIGPPTELQARAYGTVLRIFAEVLKAAKPGLPAVDLVTLAARVARDDGFEFRGPFLGHGAGMDLHERPDLVREATALQADMVLAIEPRLGNEGFVRREAITGR